MNSKRILLTGARGLVGDAILRHFHDAGWHVIVACSGQVEPCADRISVVPFDLDAVAGNTALEKAVADSDAVIHCAAILPSSGLLKTPAGARELYRKNTQGTYDLMEMAARGGVDRFVFISSANLYASPPAVIREDLEPSPTDAYMLSKLCGESVAELFGRMSKTRFYSLRVAAPYGARFTAAAVIPTFLGKALAGQPLQLMGSGTREQVFTYVGDIAGACRAAINGEGPPGAYNIAGPGPITMAELAARIVKVSGSASPIVFSDQPDPNDGNRRSIDITRARAHLGWEPAYDLDCGIAAMVQDIRNPPPPLIAAPV